jgi:tetratricopeptide (TPR) repeat protein
VYLYAGRYPERAGELQKLLELSPSFAGAKAMLALTLLFQGKKSDALEVVEQEPDEAWRYSVSPIVYWDLGRRGDSDAALRHLEHKFAASFAYQIAQIHAYRGEIDDAFNWLERAYRQRDGGMTMLRVHPLLRNLHSDPRYRALLVRMKMVD